jgi:hypothetical protein
LEGPEARLDSIVQRLTFPEVATIALYSSRWQIRFHSLASRTAEWIASPFSRNHKALLT